MIFLLVLLLVYTIASVFLLRLNLRYDTGLRHYLFGMSGIMVLPLLAIATTAATVGFFSYNGVCDDLFGVSGPCDLKEHVLLQLGFGLFSTLIFNVLWVGLVAMVGITHLALRYRELSRQIKNS